MTDVEGGRPARRQEEPAPFFMLRLFIAGEEVASTLARENLLRVCERYISGRYSIEVIDILKDFRAALENGVLMTPMLVIMNPQPPVGIVGDLSDTRKLLNAFRLPAED